MQAVPALDFACVSCELAEAGGAPHLGRNAPVGSQQLGGCDDLAQDCSGAHQPHESVRVTRGWRRQPIEAAHDVLFHARRQGWLCVVFVHQRDVVEDVLLLLQHLSHAVVKNDRELPGEARVVAPTVRYAGGKQQAAAVLVLETLAAERGAA